MSKRRVFSYPLSVLVLAGLCSIAHPARAQYTNTNQGPVFVTLEENDLVVDTDRHYTQGIKLAFFFRDNSLPPLAKGFYEHFPEFGFDSKVGKFGFQIGQSMYTPADLQATDLLPDDRPYAGWLYSGFILHRRGETGVSKLPTLESFELQLGVIGPWSLAEEAQTWVHQVRGFDLPQGWDNQLQNEPGVELRYQRAVRFAARQLHPLDIEFTPHAGFSLGNVEVTARIGGQVRLGLNLPDDYGIQNIDSLITSAGGWSGRQWSTYIFAGAEGKAVLHNAFLDGNLFHNSHRVDKEPLVGDFKAGFVFVLNRVELGYTYVFRTSEFEQQSVSDQFGSFFMKVKF